MARRPIIPSFCDTLTCVTTLGVLWQQTYLQRAPQVNEEEREDRIGPGLDKTELVSVLLLHASPGWRIFIVAANLFLPLISHHRRKMLKNPTPLVYISSHSLSQMISAPRRSRRLIMVRILPAERHRNLTVTPAASERLVEAASELVRKITIKNGTYPPDSYPNPGLFHVVGPFLSH